MVAQFKSVLKVMWQRQTLSPEVSQYMTERYMRHGMQSLKYSMAGGVLFAVFEVNHHHDRLFAFWMVVFTVMQFLHYFLFKRALPKLHEHVPMPIYILGIFIVGWWLAFLFFFGWNETSAFLAYWRGAIIFIVMVFYLDAMQYVKKILLTNTLFVTFGLLLYLHGFTNVPIEHVPRMSVSIGFGCFALLLSGLASFLLNLDVANLVTKHQKSIVELDEMASRDSLTTLYNRRYFDAQLLRHLAMYREINQDFCLVMMDIDFFKKVNDTYGHQAGDAALVCLAELVSQTLRSTDVFARYGGEEFVILLPATQLAKAHDVMDKLRANIARETFNLEGYAVQLTVSIGLTITRQGDSAETILERADSALYQAKRRGRNMVVNVV